MHHEAYNFCIKNAEETIAKKNLRVNKWLKYQDCVKFNISYKPHSKGADYPSERTEQILSIEFIKYAIFTINSFLIQKNDEIH